MIPKLRPSPPLTLRAALEIIGGLSTPSKMPGYSWSTSAKACVTGTKLRTTKNSVCSSCYAMRNNYLWPVVKAAHARRLKAIDDPRFVEAFAFALNAKYSRMKGENRFRWHDSGDVQSVHHLTQINEIARLTPTIKHWLPTRERGFVRQYLGSGKRFAPNLTVRVSFPLIGGKLTNPDHPQSTVGRDTDPDIWQCPAPRQGNQCLSCSACWNPAVQTINYHKH